VVTGELCTLIEDRFEKLPDEFLFTGLSNVQRDLPPHIGDKDDILERRVPAELAKHPEVTSGDSAESHVGDAMYVDNPLRA
jgi:hypothetical protein